MAFLIGELDPIDAGRGDYDGSGINPNNPLPEETKDGGLTDDDKLTPDDDLQDGVKKLNWSLIVILGLIGLTIVLSKKED